MEEKSDEFLIKNPLGKEINRARSDLARYGEDMRAAGITAEQIEDAITKAQERIRREFEERERQDPLTVVEKALQEVAQTQDERLITEISCRYIEWHRDALRRYAKNPEELARAESDADWRRNRGTWVRATVLSGQIETDEGRKLHIPPGLQERFLRKLGVLEDEERISELFSRNLPTINSREGFVPQPDGPVREKDPKTGRDWILRLPTNIPGVDVGTDGWAIRISIAPEALPKIQPKK